MVQKKIILLTHKFNKLYVQLRPQVQGKANPSDITKKKERKLEFFFNLDKSTSKFQLKLYLQNIYCINSRRFATLHSLILYNKHNANKNKKLFLFY